MQHVHVSGQSVYSFSLPPPQGIESCMFSACLSLDTFSSPPNAKQKDPLFATVYQPTAARLVSVRHKAHLQSLYQPERRCSEEGFSYFTSDIQKGPVFQKVGAHPIPDPI